MKNEDEEFHFDRKNYFLRFKSNDDEKLSSISSSNSNNNNHHHISKHIQHALDYFLEDLNHNRNKTIDRFLNEKTINEIFLYLAQLLTCNDERVCGNSAYIIGSTVETERGLQQFLLVFNNNENNRTIKTVDIIRILGQLLTHTDEDCVLNATGTLGTIGGSKEGRDLLLKHTCISQIILSASLLLKSTNTWISSNAALVLARITVDQIGCQLILTHVKRREILNRLLIALDVTDFNRSTNIAFAIARLLEEEEGKKIFINDCGQNKFFETLLLMLKINDDKGINKNACYALSCLCTSQYGFQLCIQSITIFHRILLAIETILQSSEYETVWFALMCLTTIGKYEGAIEHLCYSNNLLRIIKQIQEKWIDHNDIQDESKLLWHMIHKYTKAKSPKIDECRVSSVDISWESYDNDKQVQYRVILDDIPVTITNETNYSLIDLKPNTNYHVKIQYIIDEGESVISDPTVFHTDDELPPAIINLHVARTTMTAIRLAWESPDLRGCNVLKGYQVYLNEIEYELTNECNITINSLTVDTTYQIDVCVVTMKGKGPLTSIKVKTDAAGDSFPAPPIISIIGRREFHIKWQPPEVICGRLSRYELLCNGRCIYSGIEQEYHATMLKPDREYTIIVIVITNEGRFRSRPTKARTLKDEFRHSLYEQSTQHIPRLKRSDTTLSRRISSTTEKQFVREMTLPNQTIQITTVRSVQFKTEHPSYSRTLPGLFRNNQTRPSRSLQRSKTDMTSQPISATVIIPKLDISPSSTRTKSYRQTSERSPTTSLPELPYSLQRIS